MAFSDSSPATDQNYELFRFNVATGEITRLTHSARDEWLLAWSPDSRRIAYTAKEPDGDSGLLLMSANGNDVQLVRSDLHLWTQPFSWSPDGKSLLFKSMCPDVALSTQYEFPCLSNDTHYYRVILKDGHIEPAMTLPGRIYFPGPTWSPDGQRIAFASQESPGVPPQMFLAHADGSNLQRLTNDSGKRYSNPAWAATPNLAFRPLVLLTPALVLLAFAWRVKP